METPRRCMYLALWFAVVTVTATPAWADGELDASFATNGVVKIDFPNSAHGYLRAAAVVNGVLEAAGFEPEFETGGSFFQGCSNPFPSLFLVTVSLTGTVIGTPRSAPQQAIRCPSGLLIDPDTGDVFESGYALADPFSSAPVVALFDSAGTLKATYSVSGGHYDRQFCAATRLLRDNQRRFVAPCGMSGEFGYRGIGALRLSAQGGTLSGGFLTVSNFGYGLLSTVIAQDPSSGAYYFAAAGYCQYASSCGTAPIRSLAQLVMRFDADSGDADRSYGNNGVAAVSSPPNGEVRTIALDGSGNVLIGGDTGGMDVGLDTPGYIARFDPTGASDERFGTHGVVQKLADSIVDLRTDQSARVYALGASSRLLRFSVDGAPDPSFSSSSDIQLLNGPGSGWNSMQFTDDAHSSLYLLGGATECASPCASAATTAVIARVTLVSGLGGKGTTTTLLRASATKVDSGQSVTFTATVTGTNPTGGLTFKDGSAVLATENLASASASFSTSALVAGNHDITAVYSGDAHNNASTSQVVTETVNAQSAGGGGGGVSGAGGSASGGGGGSESLVELCAALTLALSRAALLFTRASLSGWTLRQKRSDHRQ